MKMRPLEAWQRFTRFYQREIWQPAQVKDTSHRGWIGALLRIVSITWTVFFETRAASRAAALSFSSLLGLGPLLAIAVLVAGFVLGQRNDPMLVANKLNEFLHFVAPQLNQYDRLDQLAPSVNPKLVDLINGIIAGARSGSAGALGFLSLILIVLILFKSVEDAFNEIWGMRRGRSWLTRIVSYWTILTLGAVLFFASITLLSVSAFVNIFVEHLPFGSALASALRWALPACSTLLVTLLLTLFYRMIPNTRVLWRAAFTGAVLVTALLTLNNFVTFLYVRRIILTKSLYGSVALPLILMSGLYIFWLFVLIGGQISYAVQNVHFRNSQAAWSRLTRGMRERLSLVVLLAICRRFQACLPAVSALQLSSAMKVPTQILNECLNHLVGLRLVTPVPARGEQDEADSLYQPARPLNRITLFDFKTLGDNLGDDPMGGTLERIDPVVTLFNEALARLGEQPFFRKTVEELIAEHPYPSDENHERAIARAARK